MICPECGYVQSEEECRESEPGFVMRIIDSNVAVKGLVPVPDLREKIRSWMTKAGLLVVTVGILQFAVAFAIIPIGLYRFILMALSIAWPFVVRGIMHSAFDPSMPPIYSVIRRWAPKTQICWAIGFGMWFLFYVLLGKGHLDGNLFGYWPVFLLHSVAGIGLVSIVFWLHDLALRMELHASAWRCNAVTWLMSTLGLIVFVSPWKHAATEGYTDLTPALVWFYVVILILPWLWVMYLLAKSFFNFASDSSWSLRYDQDIEGRLERIREKRAKLDHKYGLMDSSELHEAEVVCGNCGYSLQGLPCRNACPECGEHAV